jgi:hypothetical protein
MNEREMGVYIHKAAPLSGLGPGSQKECYLLHEMQLGSPSRCCCCSLTRSLCVLDETGRMYLKFSREATIVDRLSSPICCLALCRIDNAVPMHANTCDSVLWLKLARRSFLSSPLLCIGVML